MTFEADFPALEAPLARVKDVSPTPIDSVTALMDGVGDITAPRDAFTIALPNFDGPLDLLLHLIREHRIDILDIPMALITEKYLSHLQKMREINLDIAGEFLVMASTLLHLKSRMLLPREEQKTAQAVDMPQEQNDPRAELVKRLLEYQKYRAAAEQLASNDLLDRDSFPRRVAIDLIPIDSDEVGLQEMSIYKLIEALDRVLENLIPKKKHEVTREHLSLSESMDALAQKVRASVEAISFYGLFVGITEKSHVIITFIALLEMCKLKLLRIVQLEDKGDIFISANGDKLMSFAPDTKGIDSDYR
jgi:segregation and condensation protein A